MSSVIVRELGLQPYPSTLQAMQKLTQHRPADRDDEIWLLEHEPVFTQGQAGKPEHLLNPGDIPVVLSDRGGQVTYHGPGQLVIYLLLDLRRMNLGIRALVTLMETAVIELLEHFHINAQAKKEAPGVYIQNQKIASLGLRLKRGCSYHGLAVNIDMDLSPFSRINPCGYAGLQTTQLIDWVEESTVDSAKNHLLNYLIQALNYTDIIFKSGLPEDPYLT